MFKKITFFLIFLGYSIFSFAKNIDSILMVAPDNPSKWAYIAATVTVNNTPSKQVKNGIILPVTVKDNIFLVVYAMNFKPNLDTSCQNIQIHQKGNHQLWFWLQHELIHCQFS